jgi:dTDP-4-dehydrorhamnose reductase
VRPIRPDRAEADQESAWRVNALGPQHIAEACTKAGRTDYVFDGESPRAAREDDPPRPLNVYDRSKLAGEEKVRERLGQHVILRTSWVFSSHGATVLRMPVRSRSCE